MKRTMKSLVCAAKPYLSCNSGNIGIVFALTIIPFLGAGGLAVDYGRAAIAKSSLQAATDAAALSAASRSVEKANRNAVATSVFTANVSTSSFVSGATPTINITNDTVSVSSSTTVATTITRVLGYDNVTISATSNAAVGKHYGNAAPACVLALSTHADGAFYVNGTTNFEAINCGVYSNSVGTESLRAVGAPNVNASNFCTVGGADISGNFLPLPVTGCSAVPDPFASLTAPASEDCDADAKGHSFKKGEHTLQPGTYCGGLELMAQSAVTFEPGVYVIKGGPLIFRSGSSSLGAGVSFYLTGADAQLKVDGGAALDVHAMSSGNLAGLAFAQDASSNPGATSNIQGGGVVKIVGAVYFPTQTLEISGNGDLGQQTSAWAIVADQVHLKGNGSVQIEAAFQSEGLPEVVALPENGSPRVFY